MNVRARKGSARSLLAALAALAACSATGPPVQETFQLMTVDGQPLPATPANGPDGLVILNEQLILDGESVARRTRQVQSGSQYSEVTGTAAYRYTRDGNLVTLGDVICSPKEGCSFHPPEQGLIDATGLTLTPVPGVSPISGPVLVYHRR